MTDVLAELGELDPDDPRQTSQQIANLLRAAILTRKLGPGDKLPSQPDLASRYGVARETIKRALDILRAERLIISRQGSGAFVRSQMQRPVELRPHLEAAFEQPDVAIDFAGFSGETLRDSLSEVLDKIRAGRMTPSSVTLRILICDTTVPLALPALAETGLDDPAVRNRVNRIVSRTVESIVDQVHELADLGLISSAEIAIRTIKTSPQFKLYIINRSEVFFGFYPVVEHAVRLQGKPTETYDLMGKDVPLFHYAASDDDEAPGGQFLQGASQWFNSVWDTIAHEYEL